MTARLQDHEQRLRLALDTGVWDSRPESKIWGAISVEHREADSGSWPLIINGPGNSDRFTIAPTSSKSDLEEVVTTNTLLQAPSLPLSRKKDG